MSVFNSALLALLLLPLLECASIPNATMEEADATPSPTFIAVQKRNFINIEALSIAGIWVGTVVLVGAAVLILIELIKCNRREKNVQFKRYTFNIDAINRGLFEEEIDL